MSTLLQDLRFSLRGLMKQRGFTLVALLTLALGIGANSAIFGIVNAVLLRPLAYQEPDRVVPVWSHWTNWSKTWVSQGELVDYQEQARSLEHVAAFSPASFNLTGGGDPLRVRAMHVQPEMFAALGAQPIAGRVFTPEEDLPGHEHVVVLMKGLWRSQFGSDPSIIGRAIQLDGDTVVGVLPAALRLPLDFASRTVTQIRVPLALGPINPQARGNHGLNALGRLRPGVALAQAQAEIETITRGFLQRYADNYDKEFGLTLVPAPLEVFGDVRQLLTESMVLTAIGGATGIALAYALTRVLVALDPLKIPRVQDIAIDGRVLAFTAAISAITGILFGIVPAIQSSRAQPVLKEGGRDSRGHPLAVARARGRCGGGVGGAGRGGAAARAQLRAAARCRRRLQPVARPDAAHLASRNDLRDRRRERSRVRGGGPTAARDPGRAGGRSITGLPLATTRGDWGIRIEGQPPTGRTSTAADWQVVTPGYFEAIGTALRAGRTFTDADAADTLPVIAITRRWRGNTGPASARSAGE